MQAKPTPPLTYQDMPARQHRRQMLLQVWLPLIGTLVLVLALIVLAVIGTVQGSPQVNRWGNISAVFVILPVLVVGLVLLALTGGLAYLVNKLLKKTPGWMYSVQRFMQTVADSMTKIADAAAEPIIKANTSKSRAAAFWDRIFHRKSTGLRR